MQVEEESMPCQQWGCSSCGMAWSLHALRNPSLCATLNTRIPDWTSEEIVSSPQQLIQPQRPSLALATTPHTLNSLISGNFPYNGRRKTRPPGFAPAISFTAGTHLPTSFPRRRSYPIDCEERICFGPEGDDGARGAQ